MLNKLFPLTDFNKIKYDKEGLYSITHYNEANIISEIIKSNYPSNINLKILDGTGGLGGNTISFANYFNKVTSIEIESDRYEMLVTNVNLYTSNVKIINTDSIKYMLTNKDQYDIFFFDPPWGGPNYKKEKKLKLQISGNSLTSIADKLKPNKLLVYKLPFNYDFDEFINFNYKLYKINNYYLIILLL